MDIQALVISKSTGTVKRPTSSTVERPKTYQHGNSKKRPTRQQYKDLHGNSRKTYKATAKS